MRKALIFIVVAIVLASAAFSAGSADIIDSYFSYNDLSFSQIFSSITSFFSGSITGYAGYAGTANANLTIWDETDNSSFLFGGKTRYIDSQVFFFANFTNSTLSFNDSLANVSICINFTDADILCGNMSYNLTSALWQFNVTTIYYGTIPWEANATSITESISASDNATINNTCLNISALSSNYSMRANRTLCRGNYSTNLSIVFDDVSSLSLDCNGSVLTGGFLSGTPGPAIYVRNGTSLLIHDCSFFNSSGSDIRVDNSEYLYVRNIISELNNATDTTMLFLNSSFSTIDNISIYNSKAVFGIGVGDIAKATPAFNNTFTNIRLENISSPIFGNISANFSSNLSIYNQITSGMRAIAFGAIGQRNLRARDIEMRNIPGVCIGDLNSNGSAYSDILLYGCSNAGLGVINLADPSQKTFSFENSSIYNSGFAIVDANTSHSPSSSIRNVDIHNSTYAMAVTSEESSSFYLFSNMRVYNSITGFYSQEGRAGVINSYLEVSSLAKLQNASVNFLNVTFDKSVPSTIDSASLLRVGWFFNVLITDLASGAVENANVTLRNSSSVLFAKLTNASGNIPWQNVTEFEQTSSGTTTQSYNLSVSAEQYLLSSVDPAINESKKLQLQLLRNGSIAVYSPLNASYHNNETIDLNYTVLFSSPDKCWMTNVTGGRINLSGCANTTFTALEGMNNITVFANSTGGNLTFSKIFFTLDTVIPSITLFDMTFPDNTSISVSWETSEEANRTYRYGTDAALSAGVGYDQAFSTNGSYSLSGLQVNTYYYINTSLCDRAQNCALNSTIVQTGRGNYTPRSLHIPEQPIVVQELVAPELTAEPQRTSLTPGSRYIFTIDGEMHEIKLKVVYVEERAVFEFSSDPVTKEIEKGGSAEVDLDSDGTADIMVTVNDIMQTTVTFDVNRISFKETAPAEVEAAPAEEVPVFVAQPEPVEAPSEKTFLERYGLYLIIALIAVIAVIAGGGAVLLMKKRPAAAPAAIKKALPVPKTSHLEGMMKEVYSMLSSKKTELDVRKYLEELNLEENVIKSVVFEMNTKNNKLDQLVKFTKQQFAKGRSVESVRKQLAENGWARNIILLATEE